MKRARGPKPIPNEGLYARYMTIGKNDHGVRTVSEAFDDMGSIIDAFNHAIECVGVAELPGKIYYNRKLIFKGDICDARSSPAVQALLPPGWKSRKQLREEERCANVLELETGIKLTYGQLYNGDLLWKDQDHPLHHQRPLVLSNKEFLDPVTITFSRKGIKSAWDYDTVWMVVERNEVLPYEQGRPEMCTIPHNIYMRDIKQWFVQCHGDGWWLDKDGKNLYLGWRD